MDKSNNFLFQCGSVFFITSRIHDKRLLYSVINFNFNLNSRYAINDVQKPIFCLKQIGSYTRKVLDRCKNVTFDINSTYLKSIVSFSTNDSQFQIIFEFVELNIDESGSTLTALPHYIGRSSVISHRNMRQIFNVMYCEVYSGKASARRGCHASSLCS